MKYRPLDNVAVANVLLELVFVLVTVACWGVKTCTETRLVLIAGFANAGTEILVLKVVGICSVPEFVEGGVVDAAVLVRNTFRNEHILCVGRVMCAG